MFVTRPISNDDLPAVAAIHQSAFPDSALTKLGIEAVRRYYAWQLSGPHNVFALGLETDGRLIGFCFGGVFRGALSGFVSANRAYLVRRVLTKPYLLTNPLFRERLALGLRALRGTFRVRASRTLPSPAPKTQRSFGILSVAVMPNCQRMGVGAILMAEAETFARSVGFDAMHLTVHPANTQAVGFYQRLGWQRTMEGTVWQGQMHKTLID
jgi:ribosomal protein S18 acetylase RimI-like enzyme